MTVSGKKDANLSVIRPSISLMFLFCSVKFLSKNPGVVL